MKYLWECKTLKEQKQVCLKLLQAGKVLTDIDIWLGGADPDEIIKALRKDGVPLESCYVSRYDASDTRRKVLAWRIK